MKARVTSFFASRWRWLLLVPVAAVAAVFVVVSDRLVDDLAEQERARMQIWADATREIVNMASAPDGSGGASFDFLLGIIEGNNNIPVLLTDDEGNITSHLNFSLPEPIDTLQPLYISPANMRYLEGRLRRLRNSPNVIHIPMGNGQYQHLYYEDSRLLRSLSWYPYIELAVMLALVGLFLWAVLAVKRAEQNRVWVGLSKETAHQLGTPISSLMAWVELLGTMGVDADTTAEMDKDIKRLETIASRFSKIGSEPNRAPADLNATVERAVSYMADRISRRVEVTARYCQEPLRVMASEPLLEWVMENLVKNAVDAMEGHGSITVTTAARDGQAVVTVTDTGRGIARKNFKRVFQPGFTTKKRGWGLGLTLAKRIIEQYHRGTIAVTASEPGVGTTFTITIPLAQ